MSQTLRESITFTRTLARGLAAVNLAADGLSVALKQLAHMTHQPGRIECRFICDAPVQMDNPQTAGHLYRIAQEAVNNSLKHARAQRITIHLTCEQNHLRLQIKDDGRGLPKRRKGRPGIGMAVMHHRAHVIGALLETESQRGRGVTITCTLALENHETS
jgi:signal transduction histidine kinase